MKESESNALNSIVVVLTIVGGVVSLFSIPYEQIKEYLIMESNWAFPLILIFAFLFFVFVGYLLSYFIKIGPKSRKGIRVGQGFNVLGREETAKTVWTIVNRLNFDINNPEYIKVIRTNLEKGVKYRYIVSKTKTLSADLASYRELYKLSEKDIKEMFVFVPDNDLHQFFRSITIYDPYDNNTISYYRAFMTDNRKDDYIVFDKSKSIEYVNQFKSIWYKHQGKTP